MRRIGLFLAVVHQGGPTFAVVRGLQHVALMRTRVAGGQLRTELAEVDLHGRHLSPFAQVDLEPLAGIGRTGHPLGTYRLVRGQRSVVVVERRRDPHGTS